MVGPNQTHIGGYMCVIDVFGAYNYTKSTGLGQHSRGPYV